jgi:glutamate dehydrogenase (NAD(P)+)
VESYHSKRIKVIFHSDGSLWDITEKAFYEVYELAIKRKVNMRRAAMMLAVERVAEAVSLRGIYP